MKRFTNPEAVKKFKSSYEEAKANGSVAPKAEYDAMLRLADYEELEKTPAEMSAALSEAQEFLDAKRENRLLVLPKESCVNIQQLQKLVEHTDEAAEKDDDPDDSGDMQLRDLLWAALRMDPHNDRTITEVVPMRIIQADTYDGRGDKVYIAEPIYRIACDKLFYENGPSLFALRREDFLLSQELDMPEAIDGAIAFLEMFNSARKKPCSCRADAEQALDFSEEVMTQYQQTLKYVVEILGR